MSAEFDNISFDMPKTQSNTIKVIGVGGGGSNAVNYMYNKQIHGVDFVICNTDSQALENSPIPNKIQLGAHLTSGLGAGANPEVGAQAAAESIQEIQQMLNTHTKMVFITAGMGGGTGTGAAPIIAKIAKDMDILTVGIVTMPFQFEGRMRSKQAQKGIDELRRNVDSLIVINNNKLREVYGNLGFKSGFSKADEVLATAAKGIAEVITHHYKQNIDLHDAKTVLANSGTAIMGSAREAGDNRAKNAIIKALDSPLLNDNKITGAKNVLLLIVSGSNEVTLDEIGEINDYIQTEAGYDANIIMGIGEDEALEEGISVTVVATGFAQDQQQTINNVETKKIVHTLEEDQKATYDFDQKPVLKSPTLDQPKPTKKTGEKVVHILDLNEEEKVVLPMSDIVKTTETIKNIEVDFEEVSYENITAVPAAEFVITNVKKKQEITQGKEVTPAIQQNLLFDLPLNSYEEIKSTQTIENELLKTTEAIRNIEVVAEEVKPVYEKRYVLDDFDIQPTIGKSSVPEVEAKEEEALQFEVRTKSEGTVSEDSSSDEASPLSLTITELQRRAKERREKMKGFNYKFSDQVNKNIDDIERQPAYKRLGVDLDTNTKISKTETPLDTSSDDFPLRSNNSFLHDNVD
ncbi:cell division protein FtsZ [Tenacibaculum sp. SZ-18]|uniref:cell division protein FtsZ n=1 Tax=Tenacibaculum sp. SZ-18 TaxID=754423 RepID=UPI000C2D2798|nr:cell division protein FtsZ [Tenacibaculum sp. SZ-18]AUC14061.1 cell division protein FtsZ [Tenacibaculum sp. SZ-18]